MKGTVEGNGHAGPLAHSPLSILPSVAFIRSIGAHPRSSAFLPSAEKLGEARSLLSCPWSPLYCFARFAPARINSFWPTLMVLPAIPFSWRICSGVVSYHDAIEEIASP